MWVPGEWKCAAAGKSKQMEKVQKCDRDSSFVCAAAPLWKFKWLSKGSADEVMTKLSEFRSEAVELQKEWNVL